MINNKLVSVPGDSNITLGSNDNPIISLIGTLDTLNLGNDPNSLTITGTNGHIRQLLSGAGTDQLTIGSVAIDYLNAGSGDNLLNFSGTNVHYGQIVTQEGNDTVTISGQGITVDYINLGYNQAALKPFQSWTSIFGIPQMDSRDQTFITGDHNQIGRIDFVSSITDNKGIVGNALYVLGNYNNVGIIRNADNMPAHDQCSFVDVSGNSNHISTINLEKATFGEGNVAIYGTGNVVDSISGGIGLSLGGSGNHVGSVSTGSLFATGSTNSISNLIITPAAPTSGQGIEIRSGATVENITGSAANDVVTLLGKSKNIDLGDGNNTLTTDVHHQTYYDPTDVMDLTGATVKMGSGNDTAVLSGKLSGLRLNLGTGHNQVYVDLSQAVRDQANGQYFAPIQIQGTLDTAHDLHLFGLPSNTNTGLFLDVI